MKNFKRPKNRQNSSDFDDLWTELIALTVRLTWAIISNKFLVLLEAPVAQKFEKCPNNFSPIDRNFFHGGSLQKRKTLVLVHC